MAPNNVQEAYSARLSSSAFGTYWRHVVGNVPPWASAPEASHFPTVTRGDVEIKVVETGQIEALKKVEVKSKVAGRVSQLLVDAGSIVKHGQLLAKIDPTEINSQVAQIAAQLDGARRRGWSSRAERKRCRGNRRGKESGRRRKRWIPRGPASR